MTFLLNCYWVVAMSVGVTFVLVLPIFVCVWLGIRDAVANAYVAQCEAKIAARAKGPSDPGSDPST